VKIDRRDLLRIGLCAGAVLLSEGTLEDPSISAHERAPRLCGPPNPDASLKFAELESFTDPLPIPPVLRAPRDGRTVVEVRMDEFRHKAHRDLPLTILWGYNSVWPGPTLEVQRGQPFSINWTSRLPTKHFLPLDTTIHGAEKELPEVRTVAHVHGAQVLPESDGYPDAWFTANGKSGQAYVRTPSLYPNSQPATTLWYHDHTIGITRLNIYAGLAGFYLIRDEAEDALNLPSGRFEIPLMIQDRTFAPDGSLVYHVADGGTHPVWIQEFFGESICVNGKVAPYLDVEPRKYRFRMLNASNSRFYHLRLVPTDAGGKPSGKPADAPAFHQIGSDSGLLPAPLTMHYLILSPGERFDSIVDFTGCAGATFAMLNDAPAPYTRGGEVVPRDVMLFKVTKPLSGPDTSSLPDSLVPFVPLNPANAVRERVLALTEMDRPSDGYTMIGLLDGKHWDDPISEDPKAGSMEIWSFANTTGDVHPIHTHLVRFQVLNRQPFNVQAYLETGKLIFGGPPMPPESNERPAWKDTIKTYPGYVTRVIQRFDLPPGTQAAPGQQFRYVWHCHILEHEDNEMMRPYVVVG
jgi:spore coat protein A, manganese oxidase